MPTKVADIIKKAKRPTVSDLLLKSQKLLGQTAIHAEMRFQKFVDEGDEQIVTGQVYAPDVIDSHGDTMTAEELRKVAHQFLMDGLANSIDVQHDNRLIDAHIVESFIARAGDPDFAEGSWVVSVKINDPVVWQAVKSGVLNAYSFEIWSFRDEIDVEMEYASWYYGFTDPDPHDKHDHPFIVHMDENGEVLWGRTGLGSDGSPAHNITRASVTDTVAGKSHRIHFEEVR